MACETVSRLVRSMAVCQPGLYSRFPVTATCRRVPTNDGCRRGRVPFPPPGAPCRPDPDSFLATGGGSGRAFGGSRPPKRRGGPWGGFFPPDGVCGGGRGGF